MALCQLMTVRDKATNLQKAEQMIYAAAKGGADVIMLPEMFTTPFMGDYMVAAAEPYGPNFRDDPRSVTPTMLSRLAKETGTYIIGGSFPEAIEGKFAAAKEGEEPKPMIYNTCLCFDKEGEVKA